MGAPDIIFELRNAGYSIRADGGYLDISPAVDSQPNLLQQLKQCKPEILAALQLEQQQEARRENVLRILEADSTLKRAVYADSKSDVNNIILIIAIRNLGTCEMAVPKANLDPWQLLVLIDKAGTDYIH
ncbi:MAG: hypothetical protein H0X43_10300 [Nitrosospira sp.]|nr:hypothetical protein [Nitrosospira sp.]